jgi:hypothetical protein
MYLLRLLFFNRVSKWTLRIQFPTDDKAPEKSQLVFRETGQMTKRLLANTSTGQLTDLIFKERRRKTTHNKVHNQWQGSV